MNPPVQTQHVHNTTSASWHVHTYSEAACQALISSASLLPASLSQCLLTFFVSLACLSACSHSSTGFVCLVHLFCLVCPVRCLFCHVCPVRCFFCPICLIRSFFCPVCPVRWFFCPVHLVRSAQATLGPDFFIHLFDLLVLAIRWLSSHIFQLVLGCSDRTCQRHVPNIFGVAQILLVSLHPADPKFRK
jgi:hypothetical protein